MDKWINAMDKGKRIPLFSSRGPMGYDLLCTLALETRMSLFARGDNEVQTV